MNTVQSSELLETPKLPIAAEILDRLSPTARRTLVEFEATIDSQQREQIASLPYHTDFDRLWIPVIGLRIWGNRFSDHWNTVAHDPRFPNLRRANFNGLLVFVAGGLLPAEAVSAIIRRFGPVGYNLTWIEERLREYVRPEYATAA